MTTVDLQIAIDNANLPSEDDFQHWATLAVGSHRPSAEISIRIVDKTESQQLNAQYRGNDKPTNVLSFPAEFPEGVDIPFLGDLVICAKIVEKEAQEQRKSLESHWAHMVIHGTLHLLGYDHIEESDAIEMESLETRLMEQLGHPDPY